MTHKTTITDSYILITSDEEIKEGDYIFSTKSNNIFKADSIEYLEKHNLIEDFDKSFYISSIVSKKIIAHLPLNNAPQLEGVTLLPPLPSEEDDVEKLAEESTDEVRDGAQWYREQLKKSSPKTSDN